MRGELVDEVHLLTLEYLEFNKFLLRLEHQFEKGGSHNVTVPLRVSCCQLKLIVEYLVEYYRLCLMKSVQDLFSPFVVDEVKELALGANVALKDVKRYSWKTKTSGDFPY